MITSKELNALGIPNDKRVMPLAMRLVNVALSQGADSAVMRSKLESMCKSPACMAEDPVLGELAAALDSLFPNGLAYAARDEPAPWKQWGNIPVEEEAIQQMVNACSLPVAVRGALMPDAHVGYGLPIGGVLATKDAVIPYAVGKDIACRMRLTVLDMPLAALIERHDALVEALETETRFGVGACFEKGEKRQHPVMDEDWDIVRHAGTSKDKAWKQLGSSGCGNHFVEFGELRLTNPADLGGKYLAAGIYLALLSHSGSRGTGEAVATRYSEIAMRLRPSMPKDIRALAWLDMASEAGQEYWAAMELMGRYAAANHELIHRHVLGHLGVEAVTHVENHHNFAWKEVHDGQEVIVHRKGATPAAAGVQGIVPGSMGTPGYVVRGRGNEESLSSCSHGAGRSMSRSEAFRRLNREELSAYMRERGIELLSGGLDESPQAYKDIDAVIAGQSDLVDILAKFEPRIVKMAPEHRQRRG